MNNVTYIEDSIVPQLFTTAIEAYKFHHRSSIRSKGYDRLETFGLLWGYVVPSKDSLPAKVIATMATVETSADRHTDWVAPNIDSLLSKKEFFGHYWPNIEVVGSFHSHPYETLSEVNEYKGWRASEEDQEFWPNFHELLAPEQPLLTHIVITVANLERKGWAIPDRLLGSESSKGYVISAKNIKLWLRSYSSSIVEYEDCYEYHFSDDMELEIPALERRFL